LNKAARHHSKAATTTGVIAVINLVLSVPPKFGNLAPAGVSIGYAYQDHRITATMDSEPQTNKAHRTSKNKGKQEVDLKGKNPKVRLLVLSPNSS
jgi:hypothetical protein